MSGGVTTPRYAAPLLLLWAWVLYLPASARPWALLPGNPMNHDGSGTWNYHWLLHEHGLGACAANDFLYHPLRLNRLVMDGIPLDALCSWPLLEVLGWPAGFTVFAVLVSWLGGVAMAWLAVRWWRDGSVAVVAGVSYQTAWTLVLESHEGRLTQVFGAIFVPLVLGLAIRALNTRSARDALLAGVTWGLAALSYWYLGFFVALGLGMVAWVGRRALSWRVLASLAGGLVLVVAIPMGYTLWHLGEQPALDMSALSMLELNLHRDTLAEHTRFTSLQAFLGVGLPLRLLEGSLLAWGLLGRPRRLGLLPALWVLTGLSLAVGPWLLLPGGLRLPGPYLLLLELPVLRRWWWPTRALLLAAPAVALLVAGGWARLRTNLPARLRTGWAAALVSGLLLAEAFITMPRLPLATTPGVPSAAARVMAEGSGPTLVLPFSLAVSDTDVLPLLDQIHHGRPLLNGATHPEI